jgi:hypothetical protein
MVLGMGGGPAGCHRCRLRLLLETAQFGLGITGMSRDVSWGFYIANFTYLVGVAAGGVMVVLPYYLHDYKAYGRSPLWVNFWPSPPSSCACCLSWSTWGSPCGPQRAALPDAQFRAVLRCHRAQRLPVPEHAVVGWNVLEAERNGTHYQKWLKPLYLHLDSLGREHSHGDRLPVLRSARASLLAHRHSGAALSGIGLCRRTGPADPALPLRAQGLQLRSRQGADPEPGQNRGLRHLHQRFFLPVRGLRGLLQQHPGPHAPIKYLFVGLHGHGSLVPWMWSSMVLMLIGIILTVNPATRKNETTLAVACASLLWAPGSIRAWA